MVTCHGKVMPSSQVLLGDQVGWHAIQRACYLLSMKATAVDQGVTAKLAGLTTGRSPDTEVFCASCRFEIA